MAQGSHRCGIVVLLLMAIVIAGCTADPGVPAEPGMLTAVVTTPIDTATAVLEAAPEMAAETPAVKSSPVPTEEPQASATPPEALVPEATAENPAGNMAELAEDEIVLIYKRSGGYAGLDEEFTVYSSGRINSKDGREWQAEADQIKQLIQEIEALGFYDLSPNYKTKDPCCDYISFELTVNSGGQSHTVSGVSGAPGAPDELWTITELVQQFFNQVLRQ